MLEVIAVRKQYGDVAAAMDVSFDVRAGEVFGFLGPNGAGKTTTLRMILGITRPDAGRVVFDGRDGVDPVRVGYLPEERGLFGDAPVEDVLEYLGTLRDMTPRAARAAARAWLERLDLGARRRDKVAALSKGNQQKAQFAGAVMHRPALAILDEPFSGLDPLNQELFLDLIRELRDQGTAVLLSAHHLDLIERLADRFFLIARGREVLAGTLAEMRAHAVGGAERVLSVSVAGAPSAEAVRDALRAAAPGEVRVQAAGDGAWGVEIESAEGADLAPALAALAARFRVTAVDSRALRLHEIYLRAVREDGVAAAAEVAS
jgi:ABC-2 type transport system ATP-binding protein